MVLPLWLTATSTTRPEASGVAEFESVRHTRAGTVKIMFQPEVTQIVRSGLGPDLTWLPAAGALDPASGELSRRSLSLPVRLRPGGQLARPGAAFWAEQLAAAGLAGCSGQPSWVDNLNCRLPVNGPTACALLPLVATGSDPSPHSASAQFVLRWCCSVTVCPL